MNGKKIASATPMPSEYMAGKCTTFGNNLQMLRRERGLSAEVVANFLELSTTYVGLIERGERAPSLETFVRICEFLGKDTHEMLTPLEGSVKKGVRVAEKRPSTNVEKHEAKVKTIAGMARSFTMHELDFILNMLKFMKMNKITPGGEFVPEQNDK